SIPDIEITTDIIVGFPTETDEDFEETLNIIRDVEFLSAYTFIYSPRPGTPAAEMVQLDKNVVQKRFEKLQTLQDEIMLKRHKAYIEKIVKVLVEKHSGRKDDKTKRFTGRDEHGILVHFESFAEPTPGSIVDVKITYSAPTHLLGNLESESNKGKV
ncbi:MAG: tRNA (N6-isopentenyl adenosine(37)-C2)-methylthiotransferase MiaB, partial [Bifidobacteriaceae bacterium]|nr:tRNA (N6-isopentenyl adenosine(37)-C2)-methylthiotransferase MiaB [Bifidobacteriaceae bacterium]